MSNIKVYNTETEQWEYAVIGKQGATGATGPTGPTGATGAGVAEGGTTGQVLSKASGTDYDTEWTDVSGGGMTLLSSTTASGSSTSITSLDQTYSKLVFVGEKILCDTNTTIRLKIGSGSTYWAGAGANGYLAATQVDATFSSIGDIGSSGAGTSFYFEVFNYTSTTSRPPIIGAVCTRNDEDLFTLAGMRFTLSTIDQVTIEVASGAFTAGTLSVYGAN